MNLKSQPRKPAGSPEGGQWKQTLTAGVDVTGYPNPYAVPGDNEANLEAGLPGAFVGMARRVKVLDHPVVGSVSILPHPARSSVEIALFDNSGDWLYREPHPDFAAWDDGAFGDTRTYSHVPSEYVFNWVAVGGNLDVLKSEVASELHENWRRARMLPDGKYEPRVKVSSTGIPVDIANTEFRDLPDEWQLENQNAANQIVDRILSAPGASMEDLAHSVHEDWLERNHEWASEVQKLPYGELPEEEKEKDREVVRTARYALGIPGPHESGRN